MAVALNLRPVISRALSTAANKLVGVDVDGKTGVATVTFQRPPVNSLNLELLNEINTTLGELEKSKCRGAILTSSSKTVFSAGLDILEMFKPSRDRLEQFWTTLQDVYLKLYGSSYPTVAVINGHAPAGGCLLSICCEYRIMQKNFTIGLNETRLGIVAPKWFMVPMKNIIGSRKTELALTTGKLFTTDEAQSVGLVDEVVSSKEEGIEKANIFLNQFAKISPSARTRTKQIFRQDELTSMIKNREVDLKIFVETVLKEETQVGLEMYLQALKQKQKPASTN